MNISLNSSCIYELNNNEHIKLPHKVSQQCKQPIQNAHKCIMTCISYIQWKF